MVKYVIVGLLNLLVFDCFTQSNDPLEILSDSIYSENDSKEFYGWVYESLAENTLLCVMVEVVSDSLKLTSFSYDTYNNKREESFSIFFKSEKLRSTISDYFERLNCDQKASYNSQRLVWLDNDGKKQCYFSDSDNLIIKETMKEAMINSN